MAIEEKRAWIMLVVSVAAYATYVAIVLGRAGDTPLAAVPYVSTLLWTVGSAIVAGIVLNIATSIVAATSAGSAEATRTDQRDREIDRFGEHIGQSFVVIGALAALIMAMAELSHFWIANVIYLGFVLSAVLGSMARLGAYRDGFQPW